MTGMATNRTPEQHKRIRFIATCLAVFFLVYAVLWVILRGISVDFGGGFALGALSAYALAFALSKTLRDAD